ncbi:hypothetical protein HK104_001067 [Borealophlyctis nickersoniae]|nr:hypothetical protein HK104_001067 [Borealophlyctis nickersoniae]
MTMHVRMTKATEFWERLLDDCVYHLNEVALENCNLNGGRLYAHLRSAIHNLALLGLQNCQSDSDSLMSLALSSTRLVTLDLSGTTHVTDELVAAFASHGQLRALSLAGCDRISDACMELLPPHIETLNLAGTPITLTGLEVLATLHRQTLRSLDISHCRIPRSDARALCDVLRHLPHLFHLNIQATSAGWAALVNLANPFPPCALTSICLGNEEYLQQYDFNTFFRHFPPTQLKSLVFSPKCRFSDSSMKILLTRAPYLHRLDLPDLNNVGSTLSLIPTSTLITLPAVCRHLRAIRMVGHKVSDDVIRTMAQTCRDLEVVDVRFCRAEPVISVDGLNELAEGCKKLRRVTVVGIGIREKGLKMLRSRWPMITFDVSVWSQILS